MNHRSLPINGLIRVPPAQSPVHADNRGTDAIVDAANDRVMALALIRTLTMPAGKQPTHIGSVPGCYRSRWPNHEGSIQIQPRTDGNMTIHWADEEQSLVAQVPKFGMAKRHVPLRTEFSNASDNSSS